MKIAGTIGFFLGGIMEIFMGNIMGMYSNVDQHEWGINQ